jgi:ParB-like chromosome segregation protein Spo0J
MRAQVDQFPEMTRIGRALAQRGAAAPPVAEPVGIDPEVRDQVRQEIVEHGFPAAPVRDGWELELVDIVDQIHIDDGADPTGEDAIQIRGSLDQQTVVQYACTLRQLPPVDVFRVRQRSARGGDQELERLVLADGFHRAEAATLLGLTALPAYVRDGTWQEAQRHAVTANLHHGRALARDDRNAGIVRLRHLGWPEAQIGKAMGLSESAISLILAVATVRDTLRRRSLDRSSPAAEHRAMDRLSDRQVRAIARACPDDWGPLGRVAHQHGWNSNHLAIAVKTLKNRPELRDDLLGGDWAQVVIDLKTREFTAIVHRGPEVQAYVTFGRLLRSLRKYPDSLDAGWTHGLGDDDLQWIADRLPDRIASLTAMVDAAVKERQRRTRSR